MHVHVPWRTACVLICPFGRKLRPRTERATCRYVILGHIVLTIFLTRQLRERNTLVWQYMIDVPEPLHELIVGHLHLHSQHARDAHSSAAYERCPVLGLLLSPLHMKSTCIIPLTALAWSRVLQMLPATAYTESSTTMVSQADL